VNAEPFLSEIAGLLEALHFDAVLIGNAAAALQGAPVTTLAFDFKFRDTPVNRRKLKSFATALRATILRPYYPAADLFRVVRHDGLQIDFMATIHGVRSFAGLRDRSMSVALGPTSLRVASLPDIIRSKRAARRPQDLAVLDVLERTYEETRRPENASGRTPPRKRPRAR
jgi:hypothetical protein